LPVRLSVMVKLSDAMDPLLFSVDPE